MVCSLVAALVIRGLKPLSKEGFDGKTLQFDQIRQAFEVNVLGSLRVCTSLLPLLAENARVIVARLPLLLQNGCVRVPPLGSARQATDSAPSKANWPPEGLDRLKCTRVM